ncbi:MAG TPA: hypothetical protein ENG78_05925 [Acidiferrobacteraceae bacterium]|nr:hypothetical protein [Acidiferrobacteraceae bacterium]HEX20339.1 hypothetical protein [Acidiferrobacteraceae bacterium]
MDHAVALVEAYLHVNGYFTVTEYPVIEAMKHGGYQTATDLDILAFRFPGAGCLVPQQGGKPTGEQQLYAPDPELGVSGTQADMIIGEVKEGKAELNRGARNPAVLRAALTRFGCCQGEHVPRVVEQLLHKGRAETMSGHQVRLMAFGSLIEPQSGYDVMSLKHITNFLTDYLRNNWNILRHAQFKHPAFGFLMTLEKSRRGN